jgi:endonuclease YncB( thermonuclease family)
MRSRSGEPLIVRHWRILAILVFVGLAVLPHYVGRPDAREAQGSPAAADSSDVALLPGTVTKVIDGDTIDVLLQSGPIRVRLHGIDTPERGQPGEDEATAWLAARVLGQAMDVEPFEQDRYDRLIGIVWKDGVNVNAELVQQGHAWAYRRYMRKADATLCADEAAARLAKRGLWSRPAAERVAPWEWRRRRTLDTFTDYSGETTSRCVASIGQS